MLDRSLVCLDETSKQLIAETRLLIPKPERPARTDYEYERNTANLFMLFAPLEGWRHVKIRASSSARSYVLSHTTYFF